MKTLGYVALTKEEVQNKNITWCIHDNGKLVLTNELLIQTFRSAKKDQKHDAGAGYKSKVYKVILEEIK